MKEGDFILIQVNPEDKFYELARIEPHFYVDGEPDESRAYFCKGLAQNNGEFYPFAVDLGRDLNKLSRRFIYLGYPVSNFNGEKVKIEGKVTDLEKFKELYASLGINLQGEIYGGKYVLMLKSGDHVLFDGYCEFFSDIEFDMNGKFIKQGFWE